MKHSCIPRKGTKFEMRDSIHASRVAMAWLDTIIFLHIIFLASGIITCCTASRENPVGGVHRFLAPSSCTLSLLVAILRRPAGADTFGVFAVAGAFAAIALASGYSTNSFPLIFQIRKWPKSPLQCRHCGCTSGSMCICLGCDSTAT